MTPQESAGDGEEQGEVAAEPTLSVQAFHGRLLTRSSRDMTNHYRLNRRAMLAARWGWIIPVVGQLAIFAGGLALGSGATLIRKYALLGIQPSILIGLGVVCLLMAVLAHFLAREAARHSSLANRD